MPFFLLSYLFNVLSSVLLRPLFLVFFFELPLLVLPLFYTVLFSVICPLFLFSCVYFQPYVFLHLFLLLTSFLIELLSPFLAPSSPWSAIQYLSWPHFSCFLLLTPHESSAAAHHHIRETTGGNNWGKANSIYILYNSIYFRIYSYCWGKNIHYYYHAVYCGTLETKEDISL